MKKTLRFLFLMAMLCATVVVQGQTTLTVAEGTGTNSYVPIYGNYVDAYQRAQTLYTSDLLEDMAGGTITKMRFFVSNQAAVDFGAAVFEVRLAEVAGTTLSSYVDMSDAEVVYTGALSVAESLFVIDFTEPYVYGGGNLLLEIVVSTKGSYKSVSFYGMSVTGASMEGHSSSSLSGITSPTQRNFVPKTEFTYVEGAAPSCPKVQNLEYVVNSPYSIGIQWTAGEGNSSYLVSLNGGEEIAVEGTSYVFNGLEANTSYAATVRALCGGGDTSRPANVYFSTPCGTLSLPYTCGFEQDEIKGTANADAIPHCWTRYTRGYTTTSGANYPYSSSSSSYIHNGSRALYFYGSTSSSYPDTQMVVLPPVDVNEYPMNSLRLSFYARMSSANYSRSLVIGTLSDPDDMSTFEVLDSVTVSEAAHAKFTVALTQASATHPYVAIAFLGRASGSVYLDDLVLEPIPTCAEVPAVTAFDVASDFVTLVWIASEDPNASYTVYDMADMSVVGTGFAAASHTIENLAANTLYTFGVEVHCGAGDVSPITTVTVRTACGVVTEIPYAIDFEDATTNATPECWTKVGSGTVAAQTSTVLSGDKSLKFSGSTSNLILLPPTEAPIANLMLRFWSRPENFTSASCGTFSVGYVTDANDASSFVEMANYNYTDFGEYKEHAVTFPGAPGTARMAMRHNAGSTSYYWFVDDIVIEAAPSCAALAQFAVSDVTSNSATLSWTDPQNSNAAYLVTNETTGNMMPTYDTSVTFSNLEPATQYTFSVVAICGGGDTSMVSRVTFRTACAPLSELPYSWGFEEYELVGTTNAEALPLCWDRHTTGYTSASYAYYPYAYNSTTYAHTGSRALQFYGGTYASYPDTQVAILPEVDFYPLNNLRLSYYARMNNASYARNLYIGVLSDPADMSTLVILDSVYISGTEHSQYYINLTGAPATHRYVALLALGRVNGSIYLDDLTLMEAQECDSTLTYNEDYVACDSAYINDEWHYVSENFSFTSVTDYGCPVTINYFLTIHPSYRSEESVQAVDSYSWYGETYTVSGTYNHRFGYTSGDCDSSAVLHLAIIQSPAALPYSTGFESGDDLNWAFANDANGWVIGNAIGSGAGAGSEVHSLYISNDGGTTAGYTVGTQSMSYAYRTLQFDQAGDYNVSFDWTGKGESTYDYMRAWIAPADAEFTAGRYPDGSTSGTWTTNNPAGWKDLGGKMNLMDNWQTQSQVISIDQAGAYNLVFMWRNDNTTGTNPAAIVDNISVSALSCSTPLALTVIDVDATSATLQWQGDATAQEWVLYLNGEILAYVTDTTYLLNNLTPLTNYTVQLMTLCGDDELSNPASVSFKTPMSCSEGTCQVKVVGTDSYGDSWDNSTVEIYAEGSLVDTYTVGSGIKSPAYDSAYISVCAGERLTFSWVSRGNYDQEASFSIYNANGQQVYTVEKANSIDATVPFLTLANCMSEPVYEYDTTVVESCDFYEWNGTTYTVSGTYVKGLQVLELTIHQNFVAEETMTSTDSVYWMGSWYSQSGDYSVSVGQTYEGCDSTVTLHLAIIQPAASLPYATGFGEGEDQAWLFANGVNAWYIGDALGALNGNGLANRGLYISNDGGATVGYANSASATSYAYRTLQFDNPGDYVVSFEWLGQGESNYDYLRAWIAPATAQFVQDLYPDGSASGTWTTKTPDGWYDLGGGGKMNLKDSWQSQNVVVSIPQEGAYHLVFMWRNDPSGGTQPAAAVDNISVSALSCPAPADFTVNAELTSATATWSPVGDESQWVVRLDDQPWTVVTSPSYVFTDLVPNTEYAAYMGAVCDGGDTSIVTYLYFRTPCAAITELPWAEGFEDVEDASYPMPMCWERLNNASSEYNSYYPRALASNANGGRYSLYFYSATAASYANEMMAVMPPVAVDGMPLSAMRLQFLARANANNSGTIKIVTLSSLEDTSYTLVDSVVLLGEAYQLYTISGFPNNGDSYIAFLMNKGTTTQYAYIDDLNLEAIPSCLEVSDLTVNEVTPHSISVSWTPAHEADNSWIVFLNGQMVSTVQGTPSYTFSGLDISTRYNVSVATLCGDEISGTITASVQTLFAIEDCTALTVSNGEEGTLTTTYLPGNSVYNNSYSEVIIPAEQLIGLGEIRALQFKPTAVAGGNTFYNCQVAMANTSANDLSASFVQDSIVFQVVFEGNMSFNSTEWQTVAFSNPFVWDGESNVVVAVNRASDSYVRGATFAAYEATGQLARYAQSDMSPYVIGSVTGGTATSQVPVYRLVGCMDTAANIEYDTLYTMACDRFVWNSRTYTSSGLYTRGTQVLHLTISPSVTMSDTVVVEGDSFVWRDSVYTQSGTFSVNLGTTMYGCDSSAVLVLSLIQPAVDVPYSTGFEVTDDSWVYANDVTNYWVTGSSSTNGGQRALNITNDGFNNSYSASPQSFSYAYKALNLVGETSYLVSFDWRCKGEGSYDYLRAYMAPASAAIQSGTAPDESWAAVDGGSRLSGNVNWITSEQTFTPVSSGVYYLIFYWRNDNGVANDPPASVDNVSVIPYTVDSIVFDTLFLTETACDMYFFADTVYTQSGHYSGMIDDYTFYVLDLTVNYSTFSVDSVTACDSYTWHGETYYTSNDSAAYVTTGSNGCDSTVFLNLTLNYSTFSVDSVTACDSYTWHGETYYSSNDSAAYVITGSNGCDSTVFLNLTLNYSTFSVDSVTACDSYTWHGETYYSSNDSAAYVTTGSNGCDSTVFLNLKLHYSQATVDSLFACDYLTWHGETYFSSTDTPTFTTEDVYGCDSTVTLHLTMGYSSRVTETLSACDSLMWNGETYTQTGRYTWQTLNSEGCDSIVTLNLTVNHPTYGSDALTVCDSALWHETMYYQTGDYDWHTLNNNGCDSTVTLHLTVNYSTASADTMVACDSAFWWGWKQESGDYTFTIQNGVGCDSTMTLHLTVNQPTASDELLTVCDSALWHETMYYQTGDYDWHTVNYNGCDSTVTLHLTVNHSTEVLEEETVCDSLYWNGEWRTESGEYTHTVTGSNGCDSTTILHLTVNQPTASSETLNVCDSALWRGEMRYESGDYDWHTTNYNGCDSTVTLHLTLRHSSASDEELNVCDSALWRGVMRTESGDYTWQTVNAEGCDSTVTLHLTLRHSSASDEMLTACDSALWRGVMRTESGDYTWQTVNAEGCDSTITLHLTLNHSTAAQTAEEACDSLYWNGEWRTESGEYTHTVTGSNGCDSTTYLLLTLNHSTYAIETVTACNGYVWHGTEYTTSTQTPTFTMEGSNGCDSTTTLHLTVNHCSTTEITACDSYTWRGQTYTESGTYVDGADSLVLTVNHSSASDEVLNVCDSALWRGVMRTESGDYTWQTVNAEGCDSTVTLHLTLRHSSGSERAAEACDSYLWNNESLSQSGDYQWQTLNEEGCDSTVTLHLTVSYSSEATETVTACDSYTWHGQTYTASNSTATYTTTGENGCDSTVTLALTINRSSAGDTTAVACDSYDWYEYTGLTESQNVSHLFEGGNRYGCDSTVTLHLFINHCSTTEVTACNSYTWHNNTYTGSGMYVDGHDTLYLTVNRGATGDTFATACGSLYWNGEWRTESGEYTHTVTGSNGCDSTVTLHLTINQCSTTEVTACDSYTWHGNNYVSSGIYLDGTDTLVLTVGRSNTGDTLATACGTFDWYEHLGLTESQNVTHTFAGANAAGCDSTVTLHLTVKDCSVETVTACDSYTWHGYTFSSTGVYADGDDTLNLTIHRSSTGDTLVRCTEESFSWYEHTNLTYSQNVTHVFQNGNEDGCDSTVTLHLLITSVPAKGSSVDVVTACDSYTWHGFTLTSSGRFPLGNDTLLLTIRRSNTGDTMAVACGSFDWYEHDFLNTSQTVTHTFAGANAAGCDSIVTLHLTINQCSSESVTACDSYLWHGYNLTSTGTYRDGFDTLFLTMKRSTVGDTTAVACSGFDWYEYIDLTETQTATHVFPQGNADQCDSTVTLHLALIPCSDESVSACDSYSWHGYNITSSGVYHDGHDTLRLTIRHSVSGDTTAVACGSFSWYEHADLTETQNVTHLFEGGSPEGCDMTITLHLTVNQCGSESVSACDSYIWHGYTFSSTGVYTLGSDTLHLTVNRSTTGDTIASACGSFSWYEYPNLTETQNVSHVFQSGNAAGCDSTVALHLLILQCSSTDVTTCDSYTWHGYTLTHSGTYQDGNDTLHLTLGYSSRIIETVEACDSYRWNGRIFTASTDTATFRSRNADQCDSIVTLHLTLGRTSEATVTAEACDSYRWHGRTFTVSCDTATWRTLNATGCDSTVTLHLTVNHSVETTVNETASDSYTWHDQTYTESGTYTWTGTTAEGCDSTVTLVLTINVTGIDGVETVTVNAYPNPTTGSITIDADDVQKVEVYDLYGRRAATFDNTNRIDLRGLAAGTYTLRVTLQRGTALQRVILR